WSTARGTESDPTDRIPALRAREGWRGACVHLRLDRSPDRDPHERSPREGRAVRAGAGNVPRGCAAAAFGALLLPHPIAGRNGSRSVHDPALSALIPAPSTSGTSGPTPPGCSRAPSTAPARNASTDRK